MGILNGKKKSISSLIATILLIVVAVTLVIVLFTWSRDFTKTVSVVDGVVLDSKKSTIYVPVKEVYPAINKIILENTDDVEDLNIIGYKIKSNESYPFFNVYTVLSPPIIISSNDINSISLDCLPSGSFILQLFTAESEYIDVKISTPYNPTSCIDYNTSLMLSSPTADPVADSYTSAQSVTLSAEEGATIYYTTDGSTPTTISSVYSSAISVPLDTTMTIKAISGRTGYYTSSEYSGTYIVTHTLATPTFSPVAGEITFGTTVVISSDAGSTIYYTTDGSTPTTSSINQAVTPLVINSVVTVKALAIKSSYANSSIGSAAYTQAINIGDSYQGGIIIYILQSGDPGYVGGETHGLIAATTNQSVLYTGLEWGCYETSISTDIVIGSGNQNTLNIVAGCAEENIAAKVVSDYAGGGYTDWYLPSKNELYKMYLSRAYLSGLDTGWEYFSSSQQNSYPEYAYSYNLGTGNTSWNWKGNHGYVRAIRSF